MKFKLKKIALIAEIFGGIVILISLIFVGMQFKENAKATKSANASATMVQKTDKVNHPERIKVSIAKRTKVSHLQRVKVSH